MSAVSPNPPESLRAVDPVDVAARRLGVSAGRVQSVPAPGEATQADWVASFDGDANLELIDGTLVEKTLGADEASLAGQLLTLFEFAIEQLRLASGADDPPLRVMGPDGPVRVGRNGRQPDVSVLTSDAWRPSRDNPRTAAAPILAVEVLSESNTRREMNLKRRDYFDGGVREVWVADFDSLTVEVWRSPAKPDVYGAGEMVPADVIAAGLRVPVDDWLSGRLVRRAVELTSKIGRPA